MRKILAGHTNILLGNIVADETEAKVVVVEATTIYLLRCHYEYSTFM